MVGKYRSRDCMPRIPPNVSNIHSLQSVVFFSAKTRADDAGIGFVLGQTKRFLCGCENFLPALA